MKKELTGYEIVSTGSDVFSIVKNGQQAGCGCIGVESALEAIFVMEGMSKKDWLVCEDWKVFLVDREENGISDDCEDELMRCNNAQDIDLCRGCKRSVSDENERHDYDYFKLSKTLNGFVCDGEVSFD